MQLALEEAVKGWGDTHPNPMVGAVIVEDGVVAARGYHRRAGQAHAEVEALKVLGRAPAAGAVMYVTLEPCSSVGRTGACTDAIRKAGISRVVIGTLDPDTRHQGKGVPILEKAGIAVTVGVLEDQCRDLNLIFNHVQSTGRPLMAGKTAVTLDGKIATRNGHSRWVTGADARADVMRWRRLFPAIAVGSGTVLMDNPALSSRTDEGSWCPTRLVLDRRLRTIQDPDRWQVYSDEFRRKTILVCSDKIPVRNLDALKERHVNVWRLPDEPQEFWKAFRSQCLAYGLYGVYFEAGRELMGGLFGQRVLDYLFVYRAAKVLGDEGAPSWLHGLSPKKMGDALELEQLARDSFGQDDLIRGFLAYP